MKRIIPNAVFFAVLAVNLIWSAAGSAQTMVSVSADNEIDGTAAGTGTTGTGAAVNGTPGSTTMIVGRSGTTTMGNAVFAFQLPTLTAGQSISSATFSFVINFGAEPLTFNIDLYGLNYSASSTVTASQYYVGTNDTSATMIQQALFANGSSPTYGTVDNTSAGGNANLAAYLNQQYANGAVGGNYVFLRMNGDVFDINKRLNLESGDWGTLSARPTITFTIASVPEPRGIALVLFSGLAFGMAAWQGLAFSKGRKI